MKAWFVSDIHIMGPDDSRLARFEKFLKARLADGTSHLFLVGDIFDLWVGGDSFFSNRYEGVLALVRELRTKGIRVVYFEGNHDLHLEKIWAAELGCELAVGPRYYDLGPWRVRVEHGDQMNPDDTGYLFLRRILRTGVVESLVNTLPGALIQKIGNSMSRSSRKWTSSSLKARDGTSIREMISSHAKKVFETEGRFDLIVSGHVHVRDDFTWHPTAAGLDSHAEGEKIKSFVRSVNLGYWLQDEAPQVFCLEESGGRWVEV